MIIQRTCFFCAELDYDISFPMTVSFGEISGPSGCILEYFVNIYSNRIRSVVSCPQGLIINLNSDVSDDHIIYSNIGSS